MIDGGKNRTMAGMAFIGYVGIAADAANYSHVQVWNPAGSDKNLVLEKMTIGTNITAGIGVKYPAAALLFLKDFGFSKLLGEAQGIGQLRYGAEALVIGGSEIFSCDMSGGQPFPYEFTEPLIIPPGRSMTVYANPVNVRLTANFEWYEEKI